jgi:hypothetical protein
MGVSASPVKSQGGSPVMQDEYDFVDTQGFNEGLQVARVVIDAIVDGRFVGLSHANQIGRDASRVRHHMRDDVSPKIGGGGISVQKQHNRPRALH